MAPQVRLPKLFLEYEAHGSTTERHRYVTDELVRLIHDGVANRDGSPVPLVTSLMNQRAAVKQSIADVIYGHMLSDGKDGRPRGTQSTGVYVPPEIKAARVTLEAIGTEDDGSPRKTLRWTDGVKPIDGIVVGSSTQYNIERNEANWVEHDGPRIEVAILDAWKALYRYGENVAFAQLPQDKKDLWRIRELPYQVATQHPERGKRSRTDEARV